MSLHYLILLSPVLSLAQAATDTLLPTQSIRDGEILVSANNTFALGFFSPSNSSNNRYVGIWYYQIPVLTVVWVANRDAPIADASGVLSLTEEANLIIGDDARGSMFQLTLGSSAKMNNNTSATILDSGNLVLTDKNSGSILWQSFDHPTDHLLPGMRLGVSREGNISLTSWTSFNDPFTGDFSMGVYENRGLRLLISNGGHMYWDSGVWDSHDQVFSLVPEITTNYGYQFVYTSLGAGNYYFSYSLNHISTPERFMIDFSGRINLLKWLESDQSWMLLWSQGGPDCNGVNKCGDFAVCRKNRVDPCQCLEGFEPSSETDWSAGFWSGGCFRKKALDCNGTVGGGSDQFLAMSKALFPRFGIIFDVRSATDCESACLKDCNCTAYAFTNTCLRWYGRMESFQQLDPDVDADPGTLYVRLSASEFGEKKHKRKWIVVLAPVTFVSLCLILIASFLWRIYRGTSKLNEEKLIVLLGAKMSNKIGQNDSNGPDFTIFSFSEIAEATDNFSDTNMLGEGGFGPVYKGTLAGGHEIAVKRLSAHSGQGLNEFKSEIQLIAKLHHRNLVRLMGCCIQREEKILVYEYLPNKSLDFFLFGADKGSQLDWSRRFHIIEGIAQGLLYLHKNSRPRIIHRDLKASNILLDAKMNPKISDFGTARIFKLNEIEAKTVKVVGTCGYISPEYAAKGLYSIKSDVFSFGVLLLEIVSGKRNTSFHQHTDYINLLSYAWQMWKEKKILEVIDPLLFDKDPTAEMLRCLHIGLLCVQGNAIDRPNMAGVITMLTNSNVNLPDPKHPGFFNLKNVSREDLPSKMCNKASINIVTITEVDGR